MSKKEKISYYMKFYKKRELRKNYYGYYEIDDFKAITNSFSIIYLKDLSDDFDKIKSDYVIEVLKQKYDFIKSDLENSKKVNYDELLNYVFTNEDDYLFKFDETLIKRVKEIIGSKCEYYIVNEKNYFINEVLVIKNKKGEYAYLLPMKI